MCHAHCSVPVSNQVETAFDWPVWARNYCISRFGLSNVSEKRSWHTRITIIHAYVSQSINAKTSRKDFQRMSKPSVITTSLLVSIFFAIQQVEQ
jgi:hypothetical protein